MLGGFQMTEIRVDVFDIEVDGFHGRTVDGSE